MGFDSMWNSVTSGWNASVDYVGGAVSAGWSGATESFGSRPVGLTDSQIGYLRQSGAILPETGWGTPLQAFNEVFYRGGGALADGGLRTVGATYYGVQSGLVEAGVHRDIVSIPDAFAGSPMGAIRKMGGGAPARAAGAEARAAGAAGDEVAALKTSHKPGEKPHKDPDDLCGCKPKDKKKKKKGEEEEEDPNAPKGEKGATDGKSITRESDADPSVRDQDGTVRRGDSRSPDQIREAGGFHGHDPSRAIPLEGHMPTHREPSHWVSATQRDNAAGFAANPFPLGGGNKSFVDIYNAQQTNSGFVYNIQQPGGVLTERLSPPLQMGNGEVSFSNGIQWNNVHSWQPVAPGGVVGDIIRNPDYSGPKVPAFGD